VLKNFEIRQTARDEKTEDIKDDGTGMVAIDGEHHKWLVDSHNDASGIPLGRRWPLYPWLNFALHVSFTVYFV
jgi:hypothetical protein